MDTGDFYRELKRLGAVGILTEKDLADLQAGVMRVLRLMLDGEWHSREEIVLAAGQHGVPASEGLRRMRELRRWFDIERRSVGDGRNWQYRLLRPEELSQDRQLPLEPS